MADQPDSRAGQGGLDLEKLRQRKPIMAGGHHEWAPLNYDDFLALIDRVRELEEALRDADNHLQYIYPALDEVRQVEITAKIRRTALRVGQDRIRTALKGRAALADVPANSAATSSRLAGGSPALADSEEGR